MRMSILFISVLRSVREGQLNYNTMIFDMDGKHQQIAHNVPSICDVVSEGGNVFKDKVNKAVAYMACYAKVHYFVYL